MKVLILGHGVRGRTYEQYARALPGEYNGWGQTGGDPAERAFYRAFRDFNPLNDIEIG